MEQEEMIEQDEQSGLDAVTDPQVLQERMRDCVDLMCRQVGAVTRAEVGSVAFSNALEGAETFILAAIDLQRKYEQLIAEYADLVSSTS
jgi:hypothetical protein